MKNRFKYRLPVFSNQILLTLLICLASCVLCLVSNANDTTKVKSFSLKEAQEYAIENSYNTRNAAYDIEKAKKIVRQTTAIGLPQINGGIKYQDYIDIPVMLVPDFISPTIDGVLQNELRKDAFKTSYVPPSNNQKFPISFGSQYNGDANITVSQLLFDGTYIVGLQAAKMYEQVSSKMLTKTQLEIRESVAQAYYLVLVAEENKKILDSTLASINNTLNQTKEFLANGFVEETDVDQLQLLTSNIENKLNMVNRQIDISYNLLKFQMGVDISDRIKLSDNLQNIVDMALVKHLTSQSFDYKNHINYKIIETNQNLNELVLKKDRSTYLPNLSCFFTTARDAYRNDFNFLTSKEPWYKTTIFGISLNVPIWDSGIKHNKIQQDILEIKKTEVSMKQAQQGLVLDVENNKSQVYTYTDQYNSNIKNMELAKKIYNKTLYKYKEGVSTSLDLTQAQNQYLSTQGDYFNTILQLLNANSNLNKALGN